jgi:hypothetical protein
VRDFLAKNGKLRFLFKKVTQLNAYHLAPPSPFPFANPVPAASRCGMRQRASTALHAALFLL